MSGNKNIIAIADIANQVSTRALANCSYPVYAVTKHKGMMPSAEYFKKQIHSRDVEGYKIVQKGQFAYATIHLDEGSIGKLESADQCIISPMYTVFEVDETRVHAPYLIRLLKSPWALNQYSLMGNGTVHRRRSISFDVLGRMKVHIPPMDEQKYIATILEKADNLRHKRQETIALTDEFLRAAFVEMFGNPEVNPLGYRRGTIRELVAAANYGTAEKASEISGEFPILRMNNITYEGTWNFTSLKYVDLAPKIKDKFLVRKGDLLFNRTNSVDLVGKTAVFNEETTMAIAGYLVRVRTNDDGDPYYLAGYLNSSHGKTTLKAMAKSIVGMANINAQEMQDIPILIPPIEVQRRYGKLVQSVRASQKTQERSLSDIVALASSLATRSFATHNQII